MADEQSGQHQVSWVISGIKYMINSSCLWENKYEHVHCKENKIMFFLFLENKYNWLEEIKSILLTL